MKDPTELLVQEMLQLGFKESTIDTASTILDIGGTFASGIGSIWTSFKINRLKKRLDTVEPELRDIKKKIDKKENDIFYKQELFPLILKHLYEEDEDSKINIYINGFEYTIDEGIEEMEKLYHFYDVLAELRISDIMRLIEYCRPVYYGDKIDEEYEVDEEYEISPKDDISERLTLESYIDNKLLKLGLISLHEDENLELWQKIYYPTEFGKKFVEFFAED
jgi:hypothetical protein